MSTVAADESRDPIDVLAEEFLRRVRAGEALTPEAFAAAHREHAAALAELLPTLLVLEDCKRARERDATGTAVRVAIPALQRLGDYRIVREVGRGGMGVVFEAVQESLGRRVALKVLPQASLLDGTRLERFRREAQVGARLHHTHIVPVFGSGEADGFHYYAMQFIDGHGLDAEIERLRAAAPAPAPPPAPVPAPAPAQAPARAPADAVRDRLRRAARLCADAARALHHAHQQGTLHRDVKPSNLLLDRAGQVWVTDFGLAKALQDDALTVSGDLLGTVQYMAPEQFRGSYDVRSEVYALGVTLYELIALRAAFRGRSRTEIIDLVRHGRCERLSRLQPLVPRDLETIVARAMAPEPALRYADAAAFAADLDAFLDDRAIAARRQSPRERLWRWCRHNRAIAAAGAVAVLAIGAAAATGWSAFWITDAALQRAEQSATRAKEESGRRESTLALALTAFGDVFDTLIGPDPLHALTGESDDEPSAVPALRAPLRPEQKALLQRMLAFYDRFAAQNESSSGLRDQAASAYRRVGAIQVAFGELDAAVAAYEHAVRLLREGVGRDATRDLAATLQELGQVAIRRGQPDDAAAAFDESLQLLEGDAGADRADGSRSGRWLRARGHWLAAALPAFGPGARARGRVRDGRPGRPPGAGAGAGPGMEARWREAAEHLRTAEGLLDTLLQAEPDDPEFRFLRARCLAVRLPGLDAPGQTGRDAQQQRTQQAIEILQRLVEEHPDADGYRFELCELLLRPGRGRAEPAASLEAVTGHARTLVAHSPSHPEYAVLLARCLAQQGQRALRRGAAADAERLFRESLRHEPAAGASDGAAALAQEPRFVMQQFVTRLSLARALDAQQRTDEARAEAEQALQRLQQLPQAGPEARRLPPLPPDAGRRGEDPRQHEWIELFERLGLGDRARELLRAPDRPR